MLPPTLHDLLVFVHVLAATVLVGSSLFFPLMRRAMRSAQTAQELGAWLDYVRRAHRMNPPAALLLLASGVYLGSTGWWSQGWFFVALALFVVDSTLAARVIEPAGQKLGRALAGADGAIPAEAEAMRWGRSWDYAPDALLASDLTVLYIMLAKPSLAVTIGVVALGFVVIFGYRLRVRSASMRQRSVPRLTATAAGRAAVLTVLFALSVLVTACAPPSREELRAEGARTYAAHCEGCHGPRSAAGEAATLAAGARPVAASPASQAALEDAILSGRGRVMPPFRRTLNDRQLRGLLFFLDSNPAHLTVAEPSPR